MGERNFCWLRRRRAAGTTNARNATRARRRSRRLSCAVADVMAAAHVATARALVGEGGGYADGRDHRDGGA